MRRGLRWLVSWMLGFCWALAVLLVPSSASWAGTEPPLSSDSSSLLDGSSSTPEAEPTPTSEPLDPSLLPEDSGNSGPTSESRPSSSDSSPGEQPSPGSLSAPSGSETPTGVIAPFGLGDPDHPMTVTLAESDRALLLLIGGLLVVVSTARLVGSWGDGS